MCDLPVSSQSEQREDLVVTHHAAARPWGSGSPETGEPAGGRGPSSHAATGPPFAPDGLCALPPARNTHNLPRLDADCLLSLINRDL